MPVTTNAAPFVKDSAPPLFVALKLVTTFEPFKVSPPTEFVVSNAPLIKPAPLSVNAPLDVSETLFAPPAMLPVILIAPVLLTETAPVPACEMPVIVNGAAVFVNEITPVPLLAALKLATVLAFPNVVPVAELVVSNAPLIKPAPASLIAPSVPVKETLPAVLTLPAFNVTLRPATAEIAPVVLLTFASNKISLVVPVALNVTVPAPPAVTALPNVSVPLAFKVIAPVSVLITPLVVRAPVLLTITFPPPV